MRWGPEKLSSERFRFSLWAPAAEHPLLELEGRDSQPMEPHGDGWFCAEADTEAGSRYRFRVSPDLVVPDPASRAQADDVHGWSLIVDPDSYEWRCTGWAGRPWRESILYELHAGVLGGFDGVSNELGRIADLGVTAVELMPIAAFSGRRNWGYDGVLPYAPSSAYGTPEQLKALVDRAHERGMSIILDVVYNHFGPDGNYIGDYAPDFFDERADTPWGAAIAFEREPVRRYFIDNALMWLKEYRFDGLRFDAVHAIRDESFLAEIGRKIREKTRGRHVHLVLENEGNEARWLDGPYDAQWNDDFHNVAHVLLTGESQGYYGDFAEQPAHKLARCLEQGFIYQGDVSPGSGEPRGSPSGDLPPWRFVSFLQNHDQVGNRAMGERLIELTGKERLQAATALLLLSPQIPLLFMGEELGSRSPFLFFTDFHDELADAVREGRRKEFARFDAFADAAARETIPDPNAPGTFERSRTEPGPDAEEWLHFYRKLIALRRERIVPLLEEAAGERARAIGDGAVLATWRLADGARLILFANLGEEAVEVPELPCSKPSFALGHVGASGSFSAWLEER